jgi:lipopolysaccharide export system permease protein
MLNVKGYISLNFAKAFLTIFLPFFMIISLVYVVRISVLTAKIQIDFSELALLYSYSIPDILFYTLPLSFITALANVLVKLSQDNELIALYALGLKSKKVLHSLFVISLLFSLLLLSISFLAMPLSKQFYQSFKHQKQRDAKLNIVAGELGQKFGNYYIYVKEKEGKILKDIVIYNRTDKNNEQFFSAQKGELKQQLQSSSLALSQGFGYTYSQIKLQQVEYKQLEVFNNSNNQVFHFQNIIAYWQKEIQKKNAMKKILFHAFISLIPFLSLYIIASFTMINPRYQKNHAFLIIFLSTLGFYIIASSLSKWGTPSILALCIVVFWLMGQWLFAKRVSKFF